MDTNMTDAHLGLLAKQIQQINNTLVGVVARCDSSTDGYSSLSSEVGKDEGSARANRVFPPTSPRTFLNVSAAQFVPQSKHDVASISTPSDENLEIVQIVVGRQNYMPTVDYLEQPLSAAQLAALEYIKKGSLAKVQGNLPVSLLPSGHSRTGKALVLNGVDVYLKGSALLVAYMDQLIPIADYLIAMDIPPGRNFRFAGRVPSWAQAVLPKREKRVVAHEYISDSPKTLALAVGDGVTLYSELGSSRGWAYGRRSTDNRAGWIPLDYLAPVGKTGMLDLDD